MWYLLLTLWAYGAVVTVFVVAELDHGAKLQGPSGFVEIVSTALVALFIWPFAWSGIIEEWKTYD